MEYALVCWLAVVLALVLAFSLGLFLGRISEKLSGIPQKQGQGPARNSQHNDPMKDLHALECNIMEFWRHSEDELFFYVSRGGEKVHLSAQCNGLNGARPQNVQTRTLCDFCRKKGFPGMNRSARKKVTRGREEE